MAVCRCRIDKAKLLSVSETDRSRKLQFKLAELKLRRNTQADKSLRDLIASSTRILQSVRVSCAVLPFRFSIYATDFGYA